MPYMIAVSLEMSDEPKSLNFKFCEEKTKSKQVKTKQLKET